MTVSMNPQDFPHAYDCLVLATRSSPGVCTLKVEPKKTGWDEQKAKGEDGANTVKNGANLVKFSATFLLWKDDARDEFAAWDKWSPILDTPVKAKDPKAIDCYHPQLAELKVKSCVVTARGTIEPGKGEMTGSGTVTVEFLQFSPPKPSASVKPGGSQDKPDEANQGKRNQLQDRIDQKKELQRQLGGKGILGIFD